MKNVLILMLLLSGLVTAQTTDKPDTWKPMRFFVGVWEGTGKGEPGDSKVEREYKFTLADKFIQVTHQSSYAPQLKPR